MTEVANNTNLIDKKPDFNQQIQDITPYRPFSQKSRIMYDYRLIAIYLPAFLFAQALLLIHGMLYDPTNPLFDLEIIISAMIIYPVLYTCINWVYRSTVEYTNKIFFDEESRLKNLFKSNEEFQKFREKFYKSAYNKKELIILGLFLFPQYYNILDRFYDTSSISVIYISGFLLFQILWGLVVLSLASGMFYVIMMFIRFYKFTSADELSISEYLEWFNQIVYNSKTEKTQELKVTIYSFQHDMRVIGTFLFTFYFKFIIVLLICDMAIYIPGLILGLDNSGAAIYWVPGTFIFVFLFIVSQIKIHKILKSSKQEVMDGLIDLYNDFKKRLYLIFYENKWEDKKGILDQIEFIKSEIEELSNMGTWTYDFPEILKMVTAALLTLIPLVFELF